MDTALIGLGVVLAATTALWLLSLRMQDASIADIFWGPGFALLAWFYYRQSSTVGWRPMVMAVLLTLWGLRLGAHIAARHRGEDPRYRAMRRVHPDTFWWRSLFTVFWLQGAILWFVSLPVLVAALDGEHARVSPTDIAGAGLFFVGLAFETVGDAQLRRFRANPANRGQVLETGLWRYTRHPNYFGDALLWWGLFLIATSASRGWMTIASPIVMTLLLLRVSGVTLLEEGLKASKPGYADYIRRTSSFIPWKPQVEPSRTFQNRPEPP
jgi:steroid 5-alpha reductase family enzyme